MRLRAPVFPAILIALLSGAPSPVDGQVEEAADAWVEALVDAARGDFGDEKRETNTERRSVAPWALDEAACVARLRLESPVTARSVDLALAREDDAARFQVTLSPEPALHREVYAVADGERLRFGSEGGTDHAIEAVETASVWKALARAEDLVLTVPGASAAAESEVGIRRFGRVWRRLGGCAERAVRERGPRADPTLPMIRPEKIHMPEVVYTAGALRAGIQGVVILRVTVGVDGRVHDAEVVDGLPFGLSQAAVDAAYGSRFKPAVQNGAPVEVETMMTVNFRLQ